MFLGKKFVTDFRFVPVKMNSNDLGL